MTKRSSGRRHVAHRARAHRQAHPGAEVSDKMASEHGQLDSRKFHVHPLVRRQFFLAFPIRLLELVERHVRPHPWDDEAQRLEFHAAFLCRESPDIVGFWDGAPLSYVGLGPLEALKSVSPADAEKLGWNWNEQEIKHRLRIAKTRLSYFVNVARGYSGWLVTNRDFQNEQLVLLRQRSAEIRQNGIRGVGQIISSADSGQLLRAREQTGDHSKPFIQAVRQFLVRWRLNELAAPNLPVPATPVMAGMFPLSISNQLMDMGGVFHIPDTYPIPSRDELRDMLDEALHYSSEAPHLEEWRTIVRASNPAKNKIARFARVRQIYHYWALLHDRYADGLAGKGARLHEVFTNFFEIDIETVRRDLRFIGERLGAGWEASACFRLEADK